MRTIVLDVERGHWSEMSDARSAVNEVVVDGRRITIQNDELHVEVPLSHVASLRDAVHRLAGIHFRGDLSVDHSAPNDLFTAIDH